MSDKTPEELAAETHEPGRFSFIERLQGRAYAQDEVTIYLNEALAYDLEALKITYENTPTLSADKITFLENEIARVKEELKPDAIKFYLHGISSKQYNDIVDDAKEQFPYEYETVQNIFTGKNEKEVIQTKERTDYFLAQYWLACIDHLEDSEGNVDELTVESIKAIRDFAPIAAVAEIQNTLDKLRLATNWIEGIEDEDFLAKP